MKLHQVINAGCKLPPKDFTDAFVSGLRDQGEVFDEKEPFLSQMKGAITWFDQTLHTAEEHIERLITEFNAEVNSIIMLLMIKLMDAADTCRPITLHSLRETSRQPTKLDVHTDIFPADAPAALAEKHGEVTQKPAPMCMWQWTETSHTSALIMSGQGQLS